MGKIVENFGKVKMRLLLLVLVFIKLCYSHSVTYQ